MIPSELYQDPGSILCELWILFVQACLLAKPCCQGLTLERRRCCYYVFMCFRVSWKVDTLPEIAETQFIFESAPKILRLFLFRGHEA